MNDENISKKQEAITAEIEKFNDIMGFDCKNPQRAYKARVGLPSQDNEIFK